MMWRSQRGAALFITFLVMLVLSVLAMAAGVFSHNSLMTGRSQSLDKQAFYVAQAGIQRARQQLIAGNWTAASSPGNTYTESFGAGEYQVTIVDNGSSLYTITSGGYVPTQSSYRARRQLSEANISVSSSNGTNKSLTATASASSSNGSNTPDKANDGSNSTNWEAGTNGSGEWLAMDHGSATSLDKIIVKEQNFIDGVAIEYSDNGSAWTAVSGLSVVESPSKTWTATFTETSHRYFRSVLTASSSSKKVSIDEMQNYDSSSSLGAGQVTTSW